MVNVQLKILDDGVSPDIEGLKTYLSEQLIKDNIQITDSADLTLKIKFTVDNDQEKVLIQLRESNSKTKVSEKVIHFFAASWLNDTTNEAHALVANVAKAASNV